jgi:hypothetical protein
MTVLRSSRPSRISSACPTSLPSATHGLAHFTGTYLLTARFVCNGLRIFDLYPFQQYFWPTYPTCFGTLLGNNRGLLFCTLTCSHLGANLTAPRADTPYHLPEAPEPAAAVLVALIDFVTDFVNSGLNFNRTFIPSLCLQ